jgi:hypothetical protein
MKRWQKVQAQLEEFHRYLYPRFPRLEVKPLYVLPLVKEEKRLVQKTKLHRSRGVYLLYDAAGQLLMVGSEIFQFQKRVEQHIPNVPDARYIDVIPFDDAHWPFLLALESFLIARLKPRNNIHFFGYTIPAFPIVL